MARPRSTTGPEAPKVLEKAIRLLEAFSESTPERSEAELARELSLSTTTANRILRGLEAYAFVVRTPSGAYRLGPAAVQLGRRAAATFDAAVVLRPVLERVAARTRELVLLAVPASDGRHARYAAVVDSPQRLRVTAEIGTLVPLTAGATAKALLAFLPAEAVEAALAAPLERLAAGTVLDPAAIRRDLAEIRRRGVAFSREETFDGAWAVAVPVLDAGSRSFAAIGVAAPIHRHSPRVERAHVEAVREATASGSGRYALASSARLVGRKAE
jgi:DNA-binding IclR family transcriptional regulator